MAPLGRGLGTLFFSRGAACGAAELLAVLRIGTLVGLAPGPAAVALLGTAWPAGHQQPAAGFRDRGLAPCGLSLNGVHSLIC